MDQRFEITVNGRKRTVVTDPERTLQEVLREDLGLTGTKYGCGEGKCRACTVLLDGTPTRSCLTSIAEVERQHVQTIEGLAPNGKLHPVQQAFLEEQALQCGYCGPGMILSAVGLLRKIPNPTRAEIIDGLNGNLCRCCSYPNILKAVERAAQLSRKPPAP